MTVFHKYSRAGMSDIIDNEVSMEFLERIPGGVFRYRAHGDLEIDYLNTGLIDIFGCDSIEEFRELVGNTFKGMVHPDDYSRVNAEIYSQVEATGSDHVKYRIIRKDGEIRYIDDYGKYVVDSSGAAWFYVTILDVTDEMKVRKDYSDTLTKAMTREGAKILIDEKLNKSSESCTLMIVDVDDFKTVNDTWGHPEGDRVLQELAAHLKRAVRADDVIARLGGDEFIIFAEGLGEGEALNRIAARLVEVPYSQIKMPDSDKIYHPTISVGVATSNDSNTTLDTLYKYADKALYRSKAHGKACACFINLRDDLNDERAMRIQKGFDRDAISKVGGIKQTVLIVDDSIMNRELLKDILSSDYEILEAQNGAEAINILESKASEISLMLLDIMMPDVDGFGVLEVMNNRDWISDIPVVTISSENSNSYMQRAYELGVMDYIHRPFDTSIVQNRVANTIMLYSKQHKLVELVSDQIYESGSNNTLMILILSHIVEFRNGESGLHVMNIGAVTDILLRDMKKKGFLDDLDQSDISLIITASALHDIGKIAIDEKVLNKPGRLTDEEFAEIKRHSEIGDEMLQNLPFQSNAPLVKVARQICRWHHERYDGSGYPDGLVGDEIPISAQVVALADVYDALTSKRVYKEAYSHEKAIEMIVNGECGAFNPMLIECLAAVSDDIKEHLSDNHEMMFRKREMRIAIDEITSKLIDVNIGGHRIKKVVEKITEGMDL